MKAKILLLIMLTAGVFCPLFSGEISLAEGAKLDILSRTSLGIDLGHPYRYGLKNELTKFTLTLNMVPYQRLSNKVSSSDAVGFIDLTFFHLDMEFNPGFKPNNGGSGYNAPASVMTNRLQTGIFIAGISKGNWILQFNAGGNEPFWEPWNKSLSTINVKVAFSWAYLDSMVDVKRVKKIDELSPQDPVVDQFRQNSIGDTDTFGLNISGTTVCLMYNRENVFGVNLKFATENSYESETVTAENKNGLAAGIDLVITPVSAPNLKVMASAGGSYEYGEDSASDPVMGGLKTGYAIPLNAEIYLEPFVGADAGTGVRSNGSADAVTFEASTGLTMHWPGQGGWYSDYILDKEGRVFPGMSLAYKLYGTGNTAPADLTQSVKFTLFEPKADDGVFFGAGSEMIVDFVDVSRSSRYLFATLYFDYAIPGFLKGPGTLIPWTIVCYDNIPNADRTRNNNFKTDLGIKLVNAVSNTTFGLLWNSGNLITEQKPKNFGYLKFVTEIKF